MTDYLTTDTGRRIAYDRLDGQGPGIVFLGGFRSDMQGSKAVHLRDWAAAQGRAFLRFDYSGHGASDGVFEEGCIGDWAADARAAIEALTQGPQVLVGSSMGGWLMLLAGLALGDRLAGLVGIAAAPDFTEWGTDAAQKAQLIAGRTVYEDNPYGPEPTPTHALFWADGQASLLLDTAIAIDCPVRLIHGQADPDVPWELSLQLSAALRSDDVQVILIKDGDHRLSRDSDIALLLSILASLA